LTLVIIRMREAVYEALGPRPRAALGTRCQNSTYWGT